MKFSEIINIIDPSMNLNTLENRIEFQKKFYFLERLGAIEADFNFGLFIYGPYSSELATIGFDFFEKKIDRELKISKDFNKKLIEFHALIKDLNDDLKNLETAATIDFLKREGKSESDIKKYFEENKSFLLENKRFEFIWNILEKFNF
jgi:uncharacterized protein YwgA